MKIVFTGGGTGGHFYPIIAVAEKVNNVIEEKNIVGAELYYLSNTPYDKELLFENNLEFEQINAGKMRIYFSLKNFLDIFKSAIGVLMAIFKLFSIYPDVVFGKGGYASFPTLLAARILRIPVVIHESDAAAGRVNVWAGKFAKKIATSFEETVSSFPVEKTAWLGQPIRSAVAQISTKEEGFDFFKLEPDLPVILVLGGSQGAGLINDTVLDSLPVLLKKYQIIHQTGLSNFKSVEGQSGVVLEQSENKSRYKPMGYLSDLEIKMAVGAADLIISRAGSTLFEIACWGLPSILVPFDKSNADHSKKNAFAYARAGACVVLEEGNMTANIISSEIERIMEDDAMYEKLKKSAKKFYRPGAAQKIAEELIRIALSHEEK